MGNEESGAQQAEIITVKTLDRTKKSTLSEVEPIPPVNPLITRTLVTENYPSDIKLPAGKLPQAQAMMKDYFGQISYHLNKNEENIAKHIARQMDSYNTLSYNLEKRKNNLDTQLDGMLQTFQSLDEEIKEATDSLSNIIQRAEKLAHIIDPSLPTFEEYRKI